MLGQLERLFERPVFSVEFRGVEDPVSALYWMDYCIALGYEAWCEGAEDCKAEGVEEREGKDGYDMEPVFSEAIPPGDLEVFHTRSYARRN